MAATMQREARAPAERPAPAARVRPRSRRARLLSWLRRTHLYLGLWGAGFGLMFGVTGLLMNHRSIMPLGVQKTIQSTAQLPVPQPAPSTPAEMATWLQDTLRIQPVQAPSVKAQAPRPLALGNTEVVQPERWSIALHRPGISVSAEYFVGNRFVRIEQQDATPLGTLMRLHQSVGVNAFWVLLSDSIAGSLILLCVTGLMLWTQLHTVRTLALLTSVGALLGGAWFACSI